MNYIYLKTVFLGGGCQKWGICFIIIIILKLLLGTKAHIEWREIFYFIEAILFSYFGLKIIYFFEKMVFSGQDKCLRLGLLFSIFGVFV